ncbi:MAG: glycosyltransferase family 2 protein [Desulforhopalus sp.]
MNNSYPTISVIIPTLNGEKSLVRFFDALKAQTVQPDEILVGDSSSGDATVEICIANGAKVITIPRTEFDHGGTRTKLAQQSRGEIIVFFTQDAILADQDGIKRLIRPLLESSQIACSYGRQLPSEGAEVIAAHLRCFNYPPVSSVRDYSDRMHHGLKTVFISNSFAAYKKDQLEAVGFFKNGLIFGEDTCTLGRLLLEGYQVAYISEAAVYHSHNYSLIEEFKRSFDIGVLHKSESWLLETYGRAEGIGKQYVLSVFEMLWQKRKYLLMVECIFRSICKFTGYKLGKAYTSLPVALRPCLSLHKLWWQKHP